MTLKYILKFLCLFSIAFSLLTITANAEELKENSWRYKNGIPIQTEEVIVMNWIHLQRLQ